MQGDRANDIEGHDARDRRARRGRPAPAHGVPCPGDEDLYNDARRHRLTQLWLTDAWVRAARLPNALTGTGQFREVRHAFVTDGLDDLHAFPTALTPWLDLRRKGEAGSGVSLVFPLYDEHAVWGLDTDGATLLGGLVAYAQAVGAPYYRSPGRTGLDLLQELGKRGADAKREFPERLPPPAGQADTVTELSWLRTLSPAERGKGFRWVLLRWLKSLR